MFRIVDSWRYLESSRTSAMEVVAKIERPVLDIQLGSKYGSELCRFEESNLFNPLEIFGYFQNMDPDPGPGPRKT